MGLRLGETASLLLLLVRGKSRIDVWVLPVPVEGRARGGMGANEKGWRWSGQRWGKSKKELAAVVFFLGTFPKECGKTAVAS